MIATTSGLSSGKRQCDASKRHDIVMSDINTNLTGWRGARYSFLVLQRR